MDGELAHGPGLRRVCWKLSRIVGLGFKHLAFEAYGLGRAGELHAQVFIGTAGDGATQVVFQELDEGVPVADLSGPNPLGQGLLQVSQFSGVVLPVHLAPEAIDPQTHRFFHDLLPAMLMVGDGGEQLHRLNRLLPGGMRVKAFTGEGLSGGGFTPEKGHGNDEMHMKRAKPGAAIPRFLMANEQAVVMLRADPRRKGLPEPIQNGKQLLTRRLLLRSECQHARSVLMHASTFVDQPDREIGVAFQYFRFGPSVVALVIGLT